MSFMDGTTSSASPSISCQYGGSGGSGGTSLSTPSGGKGYSGRKIQAGPRAFAPRVSMIKLFMEVITPFISNQLCGDLIQRLLAAFVDVAAQRSDATAIPATYRQYIGQILRARSAQGPGPQDKWFAMDPQGPYAAFLSRQPPTTLFHYLYRRARTFKEITPMPSWDSTYLLNLRNRDPQTITIPSEMADYHRSVVLHTSTIQKTIGPHGTFIPSLLMDSNATCLTYNNNAQSDDDDLACNHCLRTGSFCAQVLSTLSDYASDEPAALLYGSCVDCYINSRNNCSFATMRQKRPHRVDTFEDGRRTIQEHFNGELKDINAPTIPRSSPATLVKDIQGLVRRRGDVRRRHNPLPPPSPLLAPISTPVPSTKALQYDRARSPRSAGNLSRAVSYCGVSDASNASDVDVSEMDIDGSEMDVDRGEMSLDDNDQDMDDDVGAEETSVSGSPMSECSYRSSTMSSGSADGLYSDSIHGTPNTGSPYVDAHMNQLVMSDDIRSCSPDSVSLDSNSLLKPMSTASMLRPELPNGRSDPAKSLLRTPSDRSSSPVSLHTASSSHSPVSPPHRTGYVLLAPIHKLPKAPARLVPAVTRKTVPSVHITWLQRKKPMNPFPHLRLRKPARDLLKCVYAPDNVVLDD